MLRDSQGAAAVEFALVAGPLILLMCACVELAMIILLSVTLDNATDIASRGIRTGLTTQSNTSQTAFKQTICDNMGWLSSSCMNDLNIDVRTFDSFALAAAPPDPIVNGKVVVSNFVYAVGTGSKIQLVRAYYEWPLFTPLLSGGLSTLANKDALISSKVVFRNEPF